MTQQKETKVLQIGAVAGFLLALLFFVLTLYVADLDPVWEPLFVLSLAVACQCVIRLLLTTRLQYDHDHLFVTTSGYFQKNRLDKALQKRDSVQKWADLRSYDPEHYEVKPGERELVIQYTCTAEVLSELNAVLAFLPMLLLVFAERKLPALIILLVVCVVFCALTVFAAMRARQFRFQVKSGRV